ncbi:MAG: hypothetical protein ACYC3I_13240 [Gemmataceae bacterium]
MMEDVIAFFSASFPPEEREFAACMLLVAEYCATTGVADELEPAPFNCFGFGLFASGRSTDLDAPFIGVFFDDPYPLYWVQIRTHQGVDGKLLACDECHGVEDAEARVRELIPRLLAWESEAGEA